jgi:chemotaxis protein methyltransferase CheR
MVEQGVVELNPVAVNGLFSITENEFQRIQQLLHTTAGIFLPPTKKVLVEGRLHKRLRYHGFSSYGDYIDMINSGNYPDEFQVMLDCLTTNETYFFREPAHFQFLGSQLRNIQRSGGGALRIWSAACSSGEEVYTLAMVLAEELGLNGWEIWGSDLNLEVLRNAKQGLYPMPQSESIPRSLLQRYCLRGTGSKQGYFLIDPKLCSNVHFQQVNLKASLAKLGRFDVIFLRNVMIYFDSDTKADLIKRIAQILVPGGYLFISHTESLFGIHSGMEMVKPSIYRLPVNQS